MMRCRTTQTGTWEKLGGCVGDGFHESLQLISDVIFWVVILLGADADGRDANASLNLLKNKRVSFSHLAC